MLAAIRRWAATNRPTVAAVAAALTPVLVALLTGDVQTAVDAWPALANVLGSTAVAVLVGLVTGQVAQGGGGVPVIGPALSRRAQRTRAGTTSLAAPRAADGTPLFDEARAQAIAHREYTQARILNEDR